MPAAVPYHILCHERYCRTFLAKSYLPAEFTILQSYKPLLACCLIDTAAGPTADNALQTVLGCGIYISKLSMRMQIHCCCCCCFLFRGLYSGTLIGGRFSLASLRSCCC